MAQTLLKEIEKGNKSALVKKRIISHCIHNGNSTISDLAMILDLSVPTVTKLIDEMCTAGFFLLMGNWNVEEVDVRVSMDYVPNRGILLVLILSVIH